MHAVPGRWAAALLALSLLGCAGRPAEVRRIARAMRDPLIAPREMLEKRHRLRSLLPESEGFLSEAFFPIGLYDVPESEIQEVASAGFNLIVNGAMTDSYLLRAQAAGVKVIPYINLERMEQDVARARGARSILAWYLQDEPDLNDVSPERLRALSRRLRRLDAARPIFVTVWSPDRYPDYAPSTDILATTLYPVRHTDPGQNDLRSVATAVEAARTAAAGRCVWAIVQAFWAEPWWPRNPTPEELRAMVFLALNHGADGVIYFSYRSGDRPITEQHSLYAEVRRINGEITALRGPLLMEPDDAAARSDAFGQALREAGLDASIRRYGGAILFIAVNPAPRTATVDLDFRLLGPVTLVSELFVSPGGEPLPVTDEGPISLRFHPFEVKLFWIE